MIERVKKFFLSFGVFEKLISSLYTKKDELIILFFIKKINKFKKKNPNGAFLVMTPEHGNLGDHAIAKAEQILLESISVKYFEVTYEKLKTMIAFGKVGLMNGMPIIVNGGGNLGTLWPVAENTFRSILKNNPDSVVFCLPNTIFYDNDNESQESFEESKRIYNSHEKLFLYAREKKSYIIMNDAYKNVKLIPDMALYLNKSVKMPARKGCVICLRSDTERTLTPDEHKSILKQIKSIFGENYAYSDMHIGHEIGIKKRDAELEKKFSEFRKAELVITDRLHGMIFAAITGTPCIVVKSKSHKVLGCYEWIKYLEYIKIAENIDDISELYYSIEKTDYSYDNNRLLKYYDELKEDIKFYIEKSAEV